MSYAAISRAVAARLLSFPAITAVVGQRIRPDGLDQGEPFPGITFIRTSAGYEPGIDGGDELPSPQFEVTCWARDRDGSEELADLVRSSIEDDGETTYTTSAGDVTVTAVTFLDDRWVVADDPDGGAKPIYGVAQRYVFQFRNS